jgi:hypothetical protein
MLITKANLNNVTFENEDARLLILDVVSHTSACLYYYDTEIEITVFMALKIRERAYRADSQASPYSVSLMDSSHPSFKKPSRTWQKAASWSLSTCS